MAWICQSRLEGNANIKIVKLICKEQDRFNPCTCNQSEKFDITLIKKCRLSEKLAGYRINLPFKAV